MSTRRKSTVSVNRSSRAERPHEESAALELERLEQETTLVLQEIDLNLSHANAVINDRIFPILKKYAAATGQVWTNVGFWKHFLEEAADVEILTFEEQIVPERIPILPPAPLEADVSSSPEPQIEASTPQLRSRPLMASPQILTMRKSASGFSKVAVSPKKRSSRGERRLSAIDNYLNLSPTLPEPPVLLSEVGRMQASSSSIRRHASSDDKELGRLLPIVLETPQHDGMQRFPRTPNFSSSATRSRPKFSPAREDFDDSDVPVPQLIHQNDDSDEVPVPSLQTMDVGGSPKRRRVEPDNVFLDANLNANTSNTSRNNLTVYHTIVQDEEHVSKDGRDATQNTITSLDINSSELGSFLEERWKLLSRTLRK